MEIANFVMSSLDKEILMIKALCANGILFGHSGVDEVSIDMGKASRLLVIGPDGEILDVREYRADLSRNMISPQWTFVVGVSKSIGHVLPLWIMSLKTQSQCLRRMIADVILKVCKSFGLFMIASLLGRMYY